jgi:hypothetical protein
VTEPVGKKFDGGKAPVKRGFLDYFPRAIFAVANISKYGSEKYKAKYEDKNWLHVEGAEGRYGDAQGRHEILPAIEGLYDLESGHLHAAHEAWNALARLEMLLLKGTPEKNK